MKPRCQLDDRQFPKIDSFFQSFDGRWHGWEDAEPFRHHNLGREYLVESARERAKEMAVFGIILATSAWPVIYMIVTVVQVLHKAHH